MLILNGHTKAVRCVAYSPDGRWLASGSEDQTVRLWDLANGGAQRTLMQIESGVEALAFSARRHTLAAGTAEGAIEVASVGGETPSYTIEFPKRQAVRCLAYSPDDVYLAAASWDGSVELFNAEPGEYDGSTSLPGPAHPAVLVFAPKGAHLAIGGSSHVSFLHLRMAPNWIKTTPVGQPTVAVAISPNGAVLATGHADGCVNLWNGLGGTVLRTLRGHTWTVYALAFTPNGRTLLSGSADGTVRLWDVATGTERHSYQWHKRWVTCAALSPDGMTAAAGSDDATIVVWDVDE